MSNEISAAKGIGARISRGTGSIPLPKKKEAEKEKGAKKVRSKRVPGEKPDKNIIDAEIVETTPTKVSSERTNMPKGITTGQKQLSYNPSVGAQFKDYADTYGSTHTQSPIDLSKF